MRRRQIFFPVFILCALTVFFIFLFISDTKGYIQTIFSTPQTLSLHIFKLFSLPQENIRKENVSLTIQLAKLDLIKADNASLRDQFQTSYPSQKNLLPAEIVGMPSFFPGVSMPEEYIVHVGKKDRVFLNAPVVFKDNLIGEVVLMQDHFSKVLLVSNKSTSFSAKTSETGATGIIRGEGNGSIIIDNVLLSDTLKVGDVVVTSGEVDINGKGFPPNLIIGKITSIEKNPSNLFQKASVAPLVDYSRLTNVFVLLSD